jgi:NDP-sugar pyrophosphorylase family protein
VLNGDSYCGFRLPEFLRRHQERASAATLWLTWVADARRFGLVQVADDGRLLRFDEKRATPASGWINAGVYLLSRLLLASIPPTGPVSLERECFPTWIGRGLHGFQARTPFLDIGTPESYAEAEGYFAGRFVFP